MGGGHLYVWIADCGPPREAMETEELLGTTQWTDARSDDDCVADDRTVQ